MKSLLFSVASIGAALGIQSCEAPKPATIGGTEVPAGLTCEEDEAIQFVGIDTLDCIHIDALVAGR